MPPITTLKLHRVLTDHVSAINNLACRLRDEKIDKAAALDEARAQVDATKKMLDEASAE